jgi:ABC-type antimicrobial peptide transport system permease subunit
MDEQVVEAATVNNNILKMFVFLGAVAMMLSATGLFTLVSLNIIKRLKEIGVRKVLGASVGNIARIINARFAVLLLIASLFGSLAGSFLVNALMGSIWEFHQKANAVTFVVSVFTMFVIAALSIGSKVYKTARMNPVNSLKDE